MSDERIALLQGFYRAFARCDGVSMAACYGPDAHFTDAVFDLRGDEIGAMWRMLTERAQDFRLEFRAPAPRGPGASVHWEAWYRFGATGRRVHNVIEAEFEFRDGLILRHVDRFGFWHWARQALGTPGLLLGWSGFFQRKVRATAAQNLAAFRAQPPRSGSGLQRRDLG